MSKELSIPDFLERFGSSMPLWHAHHLTGLSAKKLLAIAQEREFSFSPFLLRPQGLEHLPSLPSDSTMHRWDKGTTYRVPADTPGYISVTIHTAMQAEDSINDDRKNPK